MQLTKDFTSTFKASANASDALIVSMSPFSGFLLAKRDLGHDTLHVFEKVNTYYTYGVGQLGQAITMAARKMSKRRVLFLGSSKSGYGALFCGRSSQLERSSSLVFSPVTQVYPLEKPLYFKTFPWFMDLVAKKPHVKRCAERFGQLPASPKSIFYKETIIHGEYCDHDRNEILALKRRTINPGFMRVRHIPTRSQNVISMFAADQTTLDSFTETCINSASREKYRKSIVSGTSVSVRVDLGGRRIIK